MDSETSFEGEERRETSLMREDGEESASVTGRVDNECLIEEGKARQLLEDIIAEVGLAPEPHKKRGMDVDYWLSDNEAGSIEWMSGLVSILTRVRGALRELEASKGPQTCPPEEP